MKRFALLCSLLVACDYETTTNVYVEGCDDVDAGQGMPGPDGSLPGPDGGLPDSGSEPDGGLPDAYLSDAGACNPWKDENCPWICDPWTDPCCPCNPDDPGSPCYPFPVPWRSDAGPADASTFDPSTCPGWEGPDAS